MDLDTFVEGRDAGMFARLRRDDPVHWNEEPANVHSALPGRHGRPEEVAAAVAVFALSESAPWVNALDLRVDGGLIGVRGVRKKVLV